MMAMRSEKGSALAIALMLLMGLTALGAAFMTTSRTETQIVGNEMRHTQSLYAAEAGLNEAMARLYDPTSSSYIGEDMTAPHPGWGLYLVLDRGSSTLDPDFGLAAGDGLDNNIDGLADEGGECYPEVLSAQAALLQTGDMSPLNYPWVKVTYSLDASNNLIRFGDHDNNPTTPECKNLVAGVPVLNVTARGEQGTAERTLQVEMVERTLPYYLACLYTEDDNFQFNGQRFFISGQDFDPATGDTVVGSSRLTAISTTEDPQVILDSLDPNQYEQIIGAGGEGDVQSAPYDLDLAGYITHYSAFADFRYEGDTNNPDTGGWGGIDDYHIVFVDSGDLHLSGAVDGGGLLLIEGSLVISGTFTWYGLIITLGDVNLTGGGGGIHVYGGVMSQGNVTRNDIGGQADLLYSSSAIQKLEDITRFEVLSWKER